MYFCKINDKVVNLEHTIMADRVREGGRSMIRVTVLPGVAFDEEGPEAERFYETLLALAADPRPAPRATVVTRKVVGPTGQSPSDSRVADGRRSRRKKG